MNYTDVRMKALVEISRMVTETDNFFEIKDKIIDKMLQIIYPAKACVNLFIKDYQYAHLVCSETLEYIPTLLKNNQYGENNFPFEMYPDYIHDSVRDKKPIWIKNIFDDPRADKEVEIARNEGYQSRAVFPLISNNTVIGFLTCFFVEDSSNYTEEDIDFISSVSTLVGLSVEITRKKRDVDFMVKKLRGSLSFISMASDELYGNLGMSKFMDLLSKQLHLLTFSKASLISIQYSDESNPYESAYGEELNLEEAALKLSDYDLKTKPKIINGIYFNEDNMPHFLSNNKSIKSVIYHKLIKHDQEIGYLIGANGPKYSEDDLNIINIFATQIIFALEKFENASKLIEHKMLERELDLVQRQQQLMMPKNDIGLSEDYRISYYLHQKNVGGDFCDVFCTPLNQVCIFMGDVMGHGILSNYFVAMLKSAVKFSIKNKTQASGVLKEMNQTLYEEFNSLESYATACILIYHTKSNKITLSNGGHHLPIGIRKTEEGIIIEEIEAQQSLPLGVFQDTQYSDREFMLADYELICLYTDGIIEAKSSQGKLMGVERLKELLMTHYQRESQEIYQIIKEELSHYQQETLDDWLLLLIKKI